MLEEEKSENEPLRHLLAYVCFNGNLEHFTFFDEAGAQLKAMGEKAFPALYLKKTSFVVAGEAAI